MKILANINYLMTRKGSKLGGKKKNVNGGGE